MQCVEASNNTFVIKLEYGEPIVESIVKFCSTRGIKAAYFSGIGAVSSAELAFYDLKRRKYVNKKFDEEMELAALVGNVSMLGGKHLVHAHAVFARNTMVCVAGHLVEAKVGATCELILTRLEAKLVRKHDAKVGLNLLDLE
jgi:hypothetical protein